MSPGEAWRGLYQLEKTTKLGGLPGAMPHQTTFYIRYSVNCSLKPSSLGDVALVIRV